MKASTGRVLTASAALLALVVAGGWSLTARSQINAAPSWVPIGVASSGGGSAVWFHESSSRRVLACQTAGSPSAPTVHCAAATLP
jgi:hypothetical protein